MSTLSPSIQQFLITVSKVSELEETDVRLAATGRELWALLAGAEEQPAVLSRIEQRLALIAALRGEIARVLALARSQETLQVLGR